MFFPLINCLTRKNLKNVCNKCFDNEVRKKVINDRDYFLSTMIIYRLKVNDPRRIRRR